MKPVAFCLAASLAAVAVADTDSDVTGLIDELPKCSVDCIVKGVTSQGCNITDLDCQCSKLETLVKEVTPCLVKAGCELDQITGAGESVVKLCQRHMPNTTDGAAATQTGSGPESSAQDSKAGGSSVAAASLQHIGWLGIAALAIAPAML